jgi:hypothetical protein
MSKTERRKLNAERVNVEKDLQAAYTVYVFKKISFEDYLEMILK